MEQNTGNFVTDEDLRRKFGKDLSELHAQREKIAKLPQLEIGEVVDIKGVKFKVTRIKSNGKLGLKMLVIPVPA